MDTHMCCDDKKGQVVPYRSREGKCLDAAKVAQNEQFCRIYYGSVTATHGFPVLKKDTDS